MQSNHEGELVEAIHAARGRCAAIVINPGAFTHYAWAIHDALAAFDGPIIEVHLSNPNAREPWRHTSVVAPVATGSIVGFKGGSYALAGHAVKQDPRRMSYPAMDVAGRTARLRDRLDVDALLVTKLVNIRYLTGFTGSAALLLVLPDELLFVTDGRYRDQAAEQLAAAGVEATIRIGLTMEGQAEILGTAASGIARLGLEAHSVTWAQQRAMAATWFPFVGELVPTENVVESLRIVKDDGEVARIEAAATIATTALVNVRDLLEQHPTEHEFGLAIDTEIRRLGAEGNSFETIVGSGPNGAKPHHRASSSRDASVRASSS